MKKTVAIFVAAIAALAVVAAVLVAVLYSGTGEGKGRNPLLSQPGYELLSAVPTDAISVVLPSDLQTTLELYADQNSLLWAPVASPADPAFRRFASALLDMASARRVQSLKGAPALVSYHYTGALLPLLAISDVKGGDVRSEDAGRVLELADSLGLYSCCSHGKVLVSTNDNLLQSALRHLDSGTSVADSHGFVQAASGVPGKNVLFVCVENCGKIFSTIVDKSCLRYADFFKTLGSWAAFSLDGATPERAKLSGSIVSSEGVSQYMRAFDTSEPGESAVATMLPEKTAWFFTIPTSDLGAYVKAYQSYADSRIGISKFLARQKELQNAVGLAPKSWLAEISCTEAAVAGIDVAGAREKILLFRTSGDCKRYDSGVNDYPYSGFAASLLGGLYKASDESFCTLCGEWLVVGSRAAVSAYSDGSILESRFSDSPACVAHQDIYAGKNQLALLYVAITGNSAMLRSIFEKNYEACIEAASFGNQETFVMSIAKAKARTSVTLDLTKPVPAAPRKKAAAQTQTIEVPSGPFTVRNSGSGKDNLLSCNSGRLTLVEDGVELWSVPFDGDLCGRASNVDNFANGKIQFLFCSGSTLYMYDRLGRPVQGFPLQLDKPVLLGPDVYDFNKARKYNIMVLNQDYTIDLYNLKGQKPSQWKGIEAPEMPLGLPEYFTRGSKGFWAVRTASSTIAYPFYGGEPLVTLEGDVPVEQINLNQ